MIRDEDILLIEEPVLSASERLYLPQIAQGMMTTLRHLFKKKITVQYPEVRREQFDVDAGGMRTENYRGVHRLNRDAQGRVACVACFMCETACPAHCIHIDAGESPWPDREKYPIKFDLDELRCIYCGMCSEACPLHALALTAEYDIVALSRDELVFDQQKLAEVDNVPLGCKPPREPTITGHTPPRHSIHPV